MLNDRRNLVRRPERDPLGSPHSRLLASLALRARERIFTGVPSAFDHFEHDPVDREARLAHEQDRVAVNEDHAAGRRVDDEPVFAFHPVGVHDVVRLEAQPRIRVYDAFGAPHVPGTAHAETAVPRPRCTKSPGKR